jgi:hypothetical protein
LKLSPDSVWKKDKRERATFFNVAMEVTCIIGASLPTFLSPRRQSVQHPRQLRMISRPVNTLINVRAPGRQYFSLYRSPWEIAKALPLEATQVQSVLFIDRRNDLVYPQTMTGLVPSFLKGMSGITWEHESPFLEVDYEERHPLGAPSLKHLAMKQTLRDQRSLSQSHFVDVPWLIAKEIWDYLSRR